MDIVTTTNDKQNDNRDNQIEPVSFTIDGDHLCLDFTNTISNRHEPVIEKLTEYARLATWARQAGIVDEAGERRLLEAAQHDPQSAQQVTEQAVTLREAMFRIFSANARHDEPAEADLAIINAYLPVALARMRLASTGHTFAWTFADEPLELDMMLWRVVHSFTEVVNSPEFERVSECAGHDCTWLFVDSSRNHSRRWCDMNDCGNRAKARRHYARSKGSKSKE